MLSDSSFGFGSFSGIFNFAEILVFVMFVIILAVFGFVIVKFIRQWSRNNASPRLTVAASVVSRRMRISHDFHDATTWYYVTFQVESGDRMELPVNGRQYGLLADGDRGQLTSRVRVSSISGGISDI